MVRAVSLLSIMLLWSFDTNAEGAPSCVAQQLDDQVSLLQHRVRGESGDDDDDDVNNGEGVSKDTVTGGSVSDSSTHNPKAPEVVSKDTVPGGSVSDSSTHNPRDSVSDSHSRNPFAKAPLSYAGTLAQEARQALAGINERMKPSEQRVHSVKERIKDRIHSVKERIKERIHDAKGSVEEHIHSAEAFACGELCPLVVTAILNSLARAKKCLAADLVVDTGCEVLLLGPADPLADACAVTFDVGCPIVLKVLGEGSTARRAIINGGICGVILPAVRKTGLGQKVCGAE